AGQIMGLMTQAIVARVCIPKLRLIVHMAATLASEARGLVIRDRCAGDIDRRCVFRGDTVTRGPMVSLGVLDCRDRNFQSRGRGGLIRQIMGLMAQAIVARVRISQLQLIIQMLGDRASEAGGVVMPERWSGAVDRRRVFRDSAVNVGRIASLP